MFKRSFRIVSISLLYILQFESVKALAEAFNKEKVLGLSRNMVDSFSPQCRLCCGCHQPIFSVCSYLEPRHIGLRREELD